MSAFRTAIEQLAAKEMATDDPRFSSMAFYGGNMDDAYWGGRRDGEISLARTLLAILKGDDEEE